MSKESCENLEDEKQRKKKEKNIDRIILVGE